MHGEGVDAEETEADGDDPIRKGSFFQVAHVIDAQGYPVAGEEHLACGVGVGAVGVVEHWRSKERGKEEDEPKRSQKPEQARMAGPRRGESGGCGIDGGYG